MLILLSGLPGTGKTTLAHAICLRIGAVHIESDAVRKMLFRTPSYSGAESGLVFAEVERRARAAVASGHVVIDATNLSRGDRVPFVRLAWEAGAGMVVVRTTAPGEAVRARLTATREGFSDAGADVYHLMRGREEAVEQAHMVVDTRYATGPAVELIAALAREARR